MLESTTFGAFLAFATEQLNATTYRFLIDPENPPATGSGAGGTWVTVDLTKIPANVQTKKNQEGTCSWEEVQIDAGEEESATRLIGWSRGGNFRGVIYLARAKFPLPLPPPGVSPPSGASPQVVPSGKDYEFMTIQYSPELSKQSPNADRAGARYYGFHARIQKVRDDGQVLVAVYHAGTSQDPFEEPAVAFWLDFADINHDFSHPSSIGRGRPVGTEGALFIRRDAVTARGLKLLFPRDLVVNGKDIPTLGIAGHLALSEKLDPM